MGNKQTRHVEVVFSAETDHGHHLIMGISGSDSFFIKGTTIALTNKGSSPLVQISQGRHKTGQPLGLPLQAAHPNISGQKIGCSLRQAQGTAYQKRERANAVRPYENIPNPIGHSMLCPYNFPVPNRLYQSLNFEFSTLNKQSGIPGYFFSLSFVLHIHYITNLSLKIYNISGAYEQTY